MPVARFLATRVFCILGDSSDDSPRVSAEDFGVWAKDLPAHFSVSGHSRAVSISSTQGHPLACGLPPSRPASRQASVNNAVPRRGSRSASRPPSFAHGFVESELSTVLDNEGEVHEEPQEEEVQPDSRASSNMKRRKRGARKNKGKDVQVEQVDLTLENLAAANQTLVREISRSSKISGNGYVNDAVPPVPPIPTDAVPPTPTVTKKPSKWKLIIGKGSGDRSPTIPVPSPAVEEPITVDGRQMSKTASNVTNLVLGLSPPVPKPSSRSPARQPTYVRNGSAQSVQPLDDSTSTRGRRKGLPYGNNGGSGSQFQIDKWADNVEKRGVSPTSTRSGRYPASSASSMASSNWRSSISTTNSTRSPNTSSSAFTRYSNNSASTVATSMSSGSWRNANGSKYSVNSGHYRNSNIPPPNVKRTCTVESFRYFLTDRHQSIVMTGIPCELVEPPRQMHPNPVGGVFGTPPQRKRGNSNGTRSNNQTTGATKENNKLDTISERPTGQSMDASTSTTDLSNTGKDGDSLDGAGPKKVQKGQINALAKMLSALRR